MFLALVYRRFAIINIENGVKKLKTPPQVLVEGFFEVRSGFEPL